MIAPQWVQPRLGAIIRREKNSRFYFNELTNAPYIKGLKKWTILARRMRVNEHQFDKEAHRNCVVQFEGLGDYFSDLRLERNAIAAELIRITNPDITSAVAKFQGGFIGFHVRRGDFLVGAVTEEQHRAVWRCTPLDWYIQLAQALRRDPDWNRLPIYVISDGFDEELADLLAAPGCSRVTQGTAIGDMLLLSKARLLAAAGHSTFSMWASYLGQMPTLYCPGKMERHVFASPVAPPEREWAGGDELPRDFRR